jgi:hypothetical protein
MDVFRNGDALCAQTRDNGGTVARRWFFVTDQNRLSYEMEVLEHGEGDDFVREEVDESEMMIPQRVENELAKRGYEVVDV